MTRHRASSSPRLARRPAGPGDPGLRRRHDPESDRPGWPGRLHRRYDRNGRPRRQRRIGAGRYGWRRRQRDGRRRRSAHGRRGYRRRRGRGRGRCGGRSRGSRPRAAVAAPRARPARRSSTPTSRWRASTPTARPTPRSGRPASSRSISAPARRSAAATLPGGSRRTRRIACTCSRRARTSTAAPTADRVVVRLSANGAVDATFGTMGFHTLNIANLSDSARNGIVQTDGKIVSVGYTSQPTGVGTQTANRIVLARLNGDAPAAGGAGGARCSGWRWRRRWRSRRGRPGAWHATTPRSASAASSTRTRSRRPTR